MKRLVEGVSESVDIIPVVGMAGLGKTTLARKICNDSKLSFEFFRIIWVNVGLEYKIKDIYLTILNFFTKHIEDHFNEDVDALAKTICGFMSEEGGRCLIVLDDVWVAEVVDAVKKVFPRNKKGHRIMLTTRDGYLATYTNPDPHNLKRLTPSNSFELLEKRAFGNGNFPVELVELGKNIAQRCWGVPLATVLIAGLLRGLRNKSDWVRVESNVSQRLHNKDYDFALFIEMSYDRLPQEMQRCFLYCGIFPRGFDIPAWKLIRLWIAEGLIKPQQSSTLEEIAERHLNDLVHRNLVILLQKRSDGSNKDMSSSRHVT
uniref:NRC1 n=2 Tax=Solanum tuberosum TaxID=4113 RepID=M1ABX4_SOLTU